MTTGTESLRLAVMTAIAVMKREMRSDEVTDAPYNEDMARALSECYRALGDSVEADKWYRHV